MKLSGLTLIAIAAGTLAAGPVLAQRHVEVQRTTTTTTTSQGSNWHHNNGHHRQHKVCRTRWEHHHKVTRCTWQRY